MLSPSEDAIAASLPSWSVRFSRPGENIPAAWEPILRSRDRADRHVAATALWPAEILDRLPRFTAILTGAVTDVRVVSARLRNPSTPEAAGEGKALVYVVPDGDEPVTWIGFEPGGEVPFGESFPGLLRAVVTTVHAGLVSERHDSFGVAPPWLMRTLADDFGDPDLVEMWNDDHEQRAERLLIVATRQPELRCCVSPDIPPETLALVYEGDVSAENADTEFDDLLCSRLG